MPRRGSPGGGPGDGIGKQVPIRQRGLPGAGGVGGGTETLFERAGVRQGAMGVRQAKESQWRPLLASPAPATGPGEMIGQQGASRAGGRRETGGKGRGRGGVSGPHLLYGWLKVEVTGLFSGPARSWAWRGTASMASGTRAGLPAAPKLSQLQAQPRTPPLHAGILVTRG